jgi:hypothetical protein
MCLNAFGQMRSLKANDPVFTYSGRVEKSNSEAVSYDWPGVSIYFQFTGKELVMADTFNDLLKS